MEAVKMSQKPSYLQRTAGNWYIHNLLKDGYTNENQVLGSGSGLGNDVQTFSISLNKGWNKYGIKFQHIAHDPIQIINLFDEMIKKFEDILKKTISKTNYETKLLVFHFK